ncbi:hypothetical protein BBF96_09545 [Anoxybacter fermentans]|uniref:Amidohydrolase-related domain-containing protein n=1 Tax=Anoxybacter fermentans TaxID=1323375 RepID=A0A3Q9HR60_9FIRM|nr:amidohydrolase family protein [Anoxybacter fermentans]AZR73610.1 hypothetical protein BBF96_09545 [Anoxybacter fermentans]
MLVLRNCRVLDSEKWELTEPINLVIEGDEIKEITHSVPENCESINLDGKVVLPGLIDAHVHTTFTGDPTMYDFDEVGVVIKTAKRLKDYLKDGITTIRDVGSLKQIMTRIRKAVNEGIFIGPNIICCGEFITTTGGHGYEGGRQAEGELELRKAVREQIAHNVDFIKIIGTVGCMEDGIETGTPQYTEEEFRVVVEEAAKFGRKVAVHIGGTKAAIDAINAGAHSIEHGILFEEEAIDLMVEKGVWYVPTLTPPYRMYYDVMEGFPQWMIDKMEKLVKAHFNAFRIAVEKGAKIAAGTDAGTPFNPHGDLRFELKLMVQEGLTPLQAIQAATINGAECLGISDNYGTITPGKKADLIVLEDNPLEDINNLDGLLYVIKHGKIVVDNTR